MSIDLPQPADSRLSWRLVWVVAPTVVGFALVSLLTPIMIEKAGPGPPYGPSYVGVVFMGAVIGQYAFLAFWAVFGPQRLPVRFFAALATAALLWGVFWLGMVLADMYEGGTRGFGRAILLLPLMSLAVQGPIWILKWALGCRMVPWSNVASDDSSVEEYLSNASAGRQFGLFQMLMVTAFVAVSLGLAASFVKTVHAPEPEIWAGISIAFGVIFLASAVAAVPCICLTLIIRDRVIGIVAAAGEAIVVSLGLILLITLLDGYPQDHEDCIVFFLLVFGAVATFFVGMQVLRFCGYELMWPGRMRRWARQRSKSPGTACRGSGTGAYIQ